MALTDYTSSVANSRIKNLTNEDNFGHYFYDNVLYYFDENPNGVYMNFVAMSKKYYDETNNKTNTEITSEENIQINDDIKNAISSVNSEFGLDFEPTAEQLKEIQEFYDINNPTGDFYNDTLLQFLVQKGWVDMGDNSNVETSNSSINNSSTTNNTNRTEEKHEEEKTKNEDVIATLNINLKELIAKNETAKEIKEKYPTIFIHVYVEDALVDDELFEYYNGGQGIPDTIKTNLRVSDFYDKLKNEKRKVKITMDNTSTMIVQTTLFEGEMIFDKSGTYEIK